MTVSKEQAQRWIWFLDVVFGAIVALGIEKYEPVIREAWQQGADVFLRSLFVAISTCSFVVYDIAVYHALANKFPYRLTTLGFVRFYLDLVMAFILYVLLVNALQIAPSWVAILATISFWHFAAVIWHLLARYEHGVSGGITNAILPHVVFISIYWLIAALSHAFVTEVLSSTEETATEATLLIVSFTILVVSLFRWNQVIRKVAAAD